jgi:hypothetical protein
MPTVQEELERLLREYIETLPWYRRWAWKAWLALNPIRVMDDDIKGCLLVFILIVVVVMVLMYIAAKKLHII